MRIPSATLGPVLATAFALTAYALPCSASVRITGDRGGQIGPYLQKFESLRKSGQTVMIDGPCLSACTLVLGLIPRDHICVTSRARLGFHAAWRPDESGRPVTSQDGTDFLMANYSEQVREWIRRRGGLSQHLMYLSGTELGSMYPPCPRDQNVAAGSNFGPVHAFSRTPTSTFASSHKAGRMPLHP